MSLDISEYPRNKWIQKSIEVANAPGYLDKISKIYEMQINPERPIPKSILPEIKKKFYEKNSKGLITLLIDNAAVFPVKDSYIGFLRAKREAINENPKTVKRIGERLYSLGFKRMIQEGSRPKETNRQLGNMFKKWSLTKLKYKIIEDEDEFLRIDNQTLILKGSDKFLKRFAEEKLGCKLKKGIDIVIKKKKKYIIGEAKLLTTPGGEQDRGWDDASSFVNEKSGNAARISILDGYIWLKKIRKKDNKILHEKIIPSNNNIMSALLLEEFIKNLR